MAKLLLIIAITVVGQVRCDGDHFFVHSSASHSDTKKELKYDPIAVLAANIPGGGVPGIDYPILSRVPYTGFSCKDYGYPGYFADTSSEARCQVYHICQDDYRHDAFICPNGTLFNQKVSVCDWWFNVDCCPLTHVNIHFETAEKESKDIDGLPRDLYKESEVAVTRVYASSPSTVLVKPPATLYEVQDNHDLQNSFSIYHQPKSSEEDTDVTEITKTLSKLYENEKTIERETKERINSVTDLYQTPQTIHVTKTSEGNQSAVTHLHDKLGKEPYRVTTYNTPKYNSVLQVSDGFQLALDSQKPNYSKINYNTSVSSHVKTLVSTVVKLYEGLKSNSEIPLVSELYNTPDREYLVPSVTKLYNEPHKTLVAPIIQYHRGTKIISSVAKVNKAPVITSTSSPVTTLYKAPDYKTTAIQIDSHEAAFDDLLMHFIIQGSLSSDEEDDTSSLETLYESRQISIPVHDLTQLYQSTQNLVKIKHENSQLPIQKYSTVIKEVLKPSAALYEIPHDTSEPEEHNPQVTFPEEPKYLVQHITKEITSTSSSSSRGFSSPIFRDVILEKPYERTIFTLVPN